MSLSTLLDHAATASVRETVRHDESPAGAARARVTAPALLGLDDHRDADRWWRDLRLDRTLHGVAAQRARPVSLVIEHRGEDWPIEVTGLIGCALAWSQFALRVAGLAVDRDAVRPWVADYAERSVRVLRHVRAATSLTGLEPDGGAPLCWLDAQTLVFCAPLPAGHAGGDRRAEPLVYDATGPGFVSFEPGIEQLLAMAGASIARVGLDDETVETLTEPLLVRRLVARGRGGLHLRHAIGAGQRGGRNDLVWSDDRLDLDTAPAGLRPIRAPELRAARPPLFPARTPLRGDPGRAPQMSRTVRALDVPGLEHPARLAVFGQDPDQDTDMATLLWVRAARGAPDFEQPIPPPLPDLTTPTVALDLPLHWPADATLATLREQIVGTVRAVAAALDGAPIVVGGHSFGATLALFALAHIPDLAGAIAHSGCYNRTQTPFGFHYERRAYWDAPDVYDAFSALRFADRLRRPTLLVHGLEDANPATHPDQATQLYRAIVGTGGTARLVLLPREEHSFRYRETHARLGRIHRDWLQRASDAG